MSRALGCLAAVLLQAALVGTPADAAQPPAERPWPPPRPGAAAPVERPWPPPRPPEAVNAAAAAAVPKLGGNILW
ncbi:hypothetical protein CS0771_69450 [Catellatospora sp. IY07-71]|uniref:hypothetical protein n=1 Tax=Catellatospora sp. IY07-71 TaxID=2728827 RepID=UPI001BB33C59|nr:hypothetical protein [Catellatospora sp. IY07-71]BCJ77401.1 hypothetical protein CS0771_69450 [Catellatospora sp. IY07-71]